MAVFPVEAQNWRITPTIAVTETLTNNVDLSPSETARGDLVSEITPGFTIRGASARTQLDATVTLPVLLYAKTGSLNNEDYLFVDAQGRLEAIEKFFFVEGQITITPAYLTPIGAQPPDLASATRNRYTTHLYRISPYIEGGRPGGVQYALRNDSIWSDPSGAVVPTENSYTSQWTGRIDSPVAPIGWHADFDFTSVKFQDQGAQRTNIVRVGPLYDYSPQVRLSAIVGYEDNRYPLSDYAGFVYGAGVLWRPTERTRVAAEWEHRFFGSSYEVSFDHRTPLSVWQIAASRLISSYAQQIGALASGGRVSSVLDQLLMSSFPDPAQRQQAVEEFMQRRGLPSDMTGPVVAYTQQITLNENLRATMGLFGARNSVLVTIYRYDTQPITASGEFLPPALSFGNDTLQVGANAIWSYRLTPLSTLSLDGQWWRTTGHGVDYESTNELATLGVTTTLSPNASAFASVRYQRFRSGFPGTTDYNEAAIVAGIRYEFR